MCKTNSVTDQRNETRIPTPPWAPHSGASRDVALEVLINGPVSRADMARKLELSPGSLTRLAHPLLESGLIVEVGKRTNAGAGRPSRLLDVIPESRHFIGLKLTGTDIVGAVTDLRARVVAQESRELTSREPADVVTDVVSVLNALRAHVPDVTAVGLGIGGLVSEGGVVESAPFLGWSDVPLAAMVEAESDLPVVVANDLVAFTEYERWFGGGRNLDRFAVLTLGAGIGYGLVAGGQVIESADSGLGLVGHWPIDPYGPMCEAGHRGCARTVLTQAAIAAAVSDALHRELDYDAALDLAAGGNVAARAVVDNAAKGLGHLIAAVANLTMPSVVILGGEGVRLVEVAKRSMLEGIGARRDPRAATVEVLTTSGDNIEWCRGAAVLALQSYVLGSGQAVT